MQDSVLLEETNDHVRILRLNRPAKKNALSHDLIAAIVNGIESATEDDAVRVIGITGVGDTFCAGADLSPSARQERGEAIRNGAMRLGAGIRIRCEKPGIAGINGLAIGAGLALAMCCDMRIASSEATFHPGYARAGTSPDCGLTWTLPQAVGYERAMRFLLEIEAIDAQAAQQIGLIGEVVQASAFEDSFMAYCRKIANVAPLAARQTKHQVSRIGLPDDLEELLRNELRYTGRGLSSNDGKEAVRAIFEKRSPLFTGT